jgi:hypothetical protein
MNQPDIETEKTSASPFVEILEKDFQNPSSGLSPQLITDAIKTLSRFKGTNVEVVVPREIAKEIASGKLFRDGGVVRDSAGQIRKILKDPKAAGKLLKGPAVMFALVDLAQTVLLNEKLKEIQEQLRSIENKVDQLVQGTINRGFEEARQIAHYQKPAERNKRVHSALDFISNGVSLVKESITQQAESLRAKVHKADPNKTAFFRSRTKARTESIESARKLQKQIRLMSSLLSLRAKLQEELMEYKAAECTRAEISATVLGWAAFFRETFDMGGPMRPYGGEKNLFNSINILSMEPVDYRQKTGELCESLLADVSEQVEACVTEHTITKVLSARPVPTYAD